MRIRHTPREHDRNHRDLLLPEQERTVADARCSADRPPTITQHSSLDYLCTRYSEVSDLWARRHASDLVRYDRRVHVRRPSDHVGVARLPV